MLPPQQFPGAGVFARFKGADGEFLEYELGRFQRE
jgi:hypothetical protein